jgi:hypothetical protein
MGFFFGNFSATKENVRHVHAKMNKIGAKGSEETSANDKANHKLFN